MTELASNAFYPVSFNQVKLPMTKITITGVNQVSTTSASVSEPHVYSLIALLPCGVDCIREFCSGNICDAVF